MIKFSSHFTWSIVQKKKFKNPHVIIFFYNFLHNITYLVKIKMWKGQEKNKR